MKKYNIYQCRTDLITKKNIKINSTIKLIKEENEGFIYSTIIFDKDLNELSNILIEELKYIFKKTNLVNKVKHIFIVGIGNDNYTSDSIGPKTLKHIKVNYNIEKTGIKVPLKVSSLEPGAFGETGILTEKIITSITKEIKPDVIILIDSYITDNINYLNKTIEINNKGLYPGSGISGINSKIDKKRLEIPIIVIGVPTAVEVKLSKDNNKNYKPYILSTKDVDKYINDISKVIGASINKLINYLSQCQDNND